MPRSSRGATGHRGHRTRKNRAGAPKASVVAQTAAPVSAEPVAESTPETTISADAPSASPAATAAPATTPRRATVSQPPGATVSGASVQGDPLLNKELIRIAFFAVITAILLVVLTTVLGN